ncbi:chloride channel [Syncephalis pseudoplumigaleata]|uniref:Chloride channel protein n=1 Tax=Syncephalis pseudoplumigaleata TaxID=1712513 RepID=A0A4P9Z552_9FUNG|nr:chloride channel [Syncephalis pseudoplumigaleata]|eukprot:RKP27723.1 chloride channel [Syncephalis pseudoplumigaleata]
MASTAASIADRGGGGAAALTPSIAGPTSHNSGNRTVSTNELEAVRRYEDFTTVDWVRDTIRERARLHRLRRQRDGSWRYWLLVLYDASQSWLVVLLVGIVIGINAAFINIVTEWLSDLKDGYCSTGWWLNQKFCCWEIWDQEGSCRDWIEWSYALGLARDNFFVNWLFYGGFATLFCGVIGYLVKYYAPYAAGSGISEIKTILCGFVIHGFLGGWTLLIKSIGLALSVGSGMSIGKEGPAVHMACCVGNVVSRLFDKFRHNKSKKREIITAASAAGVGVAFGSPIGGVLFALEEMSSQFTLKTMWRSFFCAMVATVVLKAINPFRTGNLVMFQATYDRDWHFFEIILFVLIGLFGGLYGAVVIKYNLKVAKLRKKYLAQYGVQEVMLLALVTTMLGYFNLFLRLDMTELMSILFKECENGDFNGLCQQTQVMRMIQLLLWATVMRIGFTIVSYGCKVPAGIFVPSMAIGACFGRMVGIIVQSIQHTYPTFFLFSSCHPDIPCITPGAYAFLGAAAALCIMMMTGGRQSNTIFVHAVSLVVIMFELTGALDYILPTMIVAMVAKAVGDRFYLGGIYPCMLYGLPFLDKEEHTFNAPVSAVMVSELMVFPASGLHLTSIESVLSTTDYKGFPIVDNREDMHLLGYISRSELRYCIERARRLNNVAGDTVCYFSTNHATTMADDDELGSRSMLEFGPWIDQTPITVHPKQALEVVLDLFKNLGPRVILIEDAGQLIGLVTKKDVLKAVHRTQHSHGGLRAFSPATPLPAANASSQRELAPLVGTANNGRSSDGSSSNRDGLPGESIEMV